MKIGIISDIHCDVPALRHALEQMSRYGGIDQVLCAGDLVLQYRFSNEVFDLIRQWGIPTVRGNHEAAILSSAGAALRASGSIRPDNLALLETLPDFLEMQIDGKQLVMMHTSPLDPTGGGRDLRDGFSPNGRLDGLARSVGHPSAEPVPSLSRGSGQALPESRADILIVGHTHRTVVAPVGQTLVINPGSLGQPRDPDHPHRRTYAILDTSTWQASIHHFDLPLGR